MAAATSRSSSSLGGGGLQAGQGLGPGAMQGEELGGASPTHPSVSSVGDVLGPANPVPASPHWPAEGDANATGLLSQLVSGWGSPGST